MAEKKMKPVNSALKGKGLSGSCLVLYTKNHLHRIVLTASVVTGIAVISGYVYYAWPWQVSPARVRSTQTSSEERAAEATIAKPQTTSEKPVLRSDFIARAMRTDWSTPETAVRSLIRLFEQRAEAELKAYLALDVGESLDSSYLKCLGNPIEIIEVIQEENRAQVTFLAAVRTEFTLDNTGWQPGDALTLSARFLWIDDLWKCSAIDNLSCEGDTDDTEPNAP